MDAAHCTDLVGPLLRIDRRPHYEYRDSDTALAECPGRAQPSSIVMRISSSARWRLRSSA
jgi:hypothetical protein